MVFLFIRWWYSEGWRAAGLLGIQRLHTITEVLSVRLLLGSWFAPWKRLVSSGAKGLDEKFRALLDNLVSRCVGFFIRTAVLLTAAVMLLGTLLATLIGVVLWPLLPVGILYFVVRMITG